MWFLCMCKISNKKETQSWQAAMLPEHAPLSWKLPACSHGQHSQRSSPAMEPHVEVPPEKPLQGPLTILQDLLLGWALTIFFFARVILHLCPHLARNPVDLNPHGFDLLAWPWIYLITMLSVIITHSTVNLHFWLKTIYRPVMIALLWHCRPGSFWGDGTLFALLLGYPCLVVHPVLAQLQGYLSYNAGGKKKIISVKN